MTTIGGVGLARRLAFALSLVSSSLLGTAWGEETTGSRLAAPAGVQESTTSIMQRQAVSPPQEEERPEHELEYPDRSGLKQNPDAPAVSSYPAPGPEEKKAALVSRNIHTTGLSFDGATLTDTGA